MLSMAETKISNLQDNEKNLEQQQERQTQLINEQKQQEAILQEVSLLNLKVAK